MDLAVRQHTDTGLTVHTAPLCNTNVAISDVMALSVSISKCDGTILSAEKMSSLIQQTDVKLIKSYYDKNFSGNDDEKHSLSYGTYDTVYSTKRLVGIYVKKKQDLVDEKKRFALFTAAHVVADTNVREYRRRILTPKKAIIIKSLPWINNSDEAIVFLVYGEHLQLNKLFAATMSVGCKYTEQTFKLNFDGDVTMSASNKNNTCCLLIRSVVSDNYAYFEFDVVRHSNMLLKHIYHFKCADSLTLLPTYESDTTLLERINIILGRKEDVTIADPVGITVVKPKSTTLFSTKDHETLVSASAIADPMPIFALPTIGKPKFAGFDITPCDNIPALALAKPYCVLQLPYNTKVKNTVIPTGCNKNAILFHASKRVADYERVVKGLGYNFAMYVALNNPVKRSTAQVVCVYVNGTTYVPATPYLHSKLDPADGALNTYMHDICTFLIQLNAKGLAVVNDPSLFSKRFDNSSGSAPGVDDIDTMSSEDEDSDNEDETTKLTKISGDLYIAIYRLVDSCTSDISPISKFFTSTNIQDAAEGAKQLLKLKEEINDKGKKNTKGKIKAATCPSITYAQTEIKYELFPGAFEYDMFDDDKTYKEIYDTLTTKAKSDELDAIQKIYDINKHRIPVLPCKGTPHNNLDVDGQFAPSDKDRDQCIAILTALYKYVSTDPTNYSIRKLVKSMKECCTASAGSPYNNEIKSLCIEFGNEILLYDLLHKLYSNALAIPNAKLANMCAAPMIYLDNYCYNILCSVKESIDKAIHVEISKHELNIINTILGEITSYPECTSDIKDVIKKRDELANVVITSVLTPTPMRTIKFSGHGKYSKQLEKFLAAFEALKVKPDARIQDSFMYKIESMLLKLPLSNLTEIDKMCNDVHSKYTNAKNTDNYNMSAFIDAAFITRLAELSSPFLVVDTIFAYIRSKSDQARLEAAIDSAHEFVVNNKKNTYFNSIEQTIRDRLYELYETYATAAKSTFEDNKKKKIEALTKPAAKAKASKLTAYDNNVKAIEDEYRRIDADAVTYFAIKRTYQDYLAEISTVVSITRVVSIFYDDTGLTWP